MKQKILTLLFCLATLAATAQIQPTTALIGSWSGKLKFGPMSLTLVLHLEQADGYVTATFDSPDQGAKGIPAMKEFLSDDSLAVGVESLDMTYCAKLKEGKLDGTFTQRGHSLPLVMARGVPELKRPQQPHPPYPYKTQEVTFKNKADGAKLAGTLTWPVKSGHDKHWKPTVVLLVSGSGQQNRDEELMGHAPFLVLADYLARQVISSLNLPAIRRLLPSSPQNLVREYPGLNHLFQHCTTGLPDEYGRIEETISPEVLQDIAQWIHSLE